MYYYPLYCVVSLWYVMLYTMLMHVCMVSYWYPLFHCWAINVTDMINTDCNQNRVILQLSQW